MAHQEPLVLPSKSEVERRLEATIAYWRDWAHARTVRGDRRDAVIRSALALKLLVHSPTGAVAAAATTSLPEDVGGERNWDYRFSWTRDSAFVMEALLGRGRRRLGRGVLLVADASVAITQPHLQVLYRLDGGANAKERTLPLDGYFDRGRFASGTRRSSTAARHLRGSPSDRVAVCRGRLRGRPRIRHEVGGDRGPGLRDLDGARRRPGRFAASSTLHATKMLCWVALIAQFGSALAGHIPRRRRPLANDGGCHPRLHRGSLLVTGEAQLHAGGRQL
jgi:hypothetical protein